ncbi:MAG TPA: regulatory protein RecX [Flavobacteriaceae bacterium]|nr:regulatory protein RecX [Flavobacteriaceae bacterium]
MFKTHKTYTVAEATQKLMNYCVYRERCHKEVEKKLDELRMIPEAKAQIINKLLQEDFLNEERFAKSFARGKFRIKKWGKIRILRELKQRDISKYNITSAMEEIDENEYLKTLDETARKKLTLIPDKNPAKRKKKLADHLFYKGYESPLVYEKVHELITS